MMKSIVRSVVVFVVLALPLVVQGEGRQEAMKSTAQPVSKATSISQTMTARASNSCPDCPKCKECPACHEDPKLVPVAVKAFAFGSLCINRIDGPILGKDTTPGHYHYLISVGANSASEKLQYVPAELRFSLTCNGGIRDSNDIKRVVDSGSLYSGVFYDYLSDGNYDLSKCELQVVLDPNDKLTGMNKDKAIVTCKEMIPLSPENLSETAPNGWCATLYDVASFEGKCYFVPPNTK